MDIIPEIIAELMIIDDLVSAENHQSHRYIRLHGY